VFFFLPVVLVAQAAPGQGDDHQRHRPNADQNWHDAPILGQQPTGALEYERESEEVIEHE
jgi:hypothetical protein